MLRKNEVILINIELGCRSKPKYAKLIVLKHVTNNVCAVNSFLTNYVCTALSIYRLIVKNWHHIYCLK